MSKVSIITTTYNHKNFIALTIESILSQTYTDWELIIGDDSANNDSWDIIQ
jgi:glycosyltransferase involved in cell wall biosynthesis